VSIAGQSPSGKSERREINDPKMHGMRAAYILSPHVLPFLFSDQIEWMEASGRGRIYTYTIVRSNAPSSFIADMPFVIAVVRLEEGVQMLSNIVDCEPTAVIVKCLSRLPSKNCRMNLRCLNSGLHKHK
jgi:hypothetical protein